MRCSPLRRSWMSSALRPFSHTNQSQSRRARSASGSTVKPMVWSLIQPVTMLCPFTGMKGHIMEQWICRYKNRATIFSILYQREHGAFRLHNPIFRAFILVCAVTGYPAAFLKQKRPDQPGISPIDIRQYLRHGNITIVPSSLN